MTNLFRLVWVRAAAMLAACAVFFSGVGYAFAAAPAQASGDSIFDNLIFVVLAGVLLALFASLAGGAVVAALAVLLSRFFRRNLPTDEEMTQLKSELNTPSKPRKPLKIGPAAEPIVISLVCFVGGLAIFGAVLGSGPSVSFGQYVEPTPAAPAQTLPKEGDFAKITDGLPEGNPANGEKLFASSGCVGCHSQKQGERLIGPTFYNLWDTAATRVPGLAAKEYLYQSIVNPNAHVVETFQPNIMQQNYASLLSPQQMADILAWIEERHSNEP